MTFASPPLSLGLDIYNVVHEIAFFPVFRAKSMGFLQLAEFCCPRLLVVDKSIVTKF